MSKLLLLFSFAGLSACGGPADPIWAPQDAIQKYSYRHNGPPMITLYTVVSTKSGSGAHSGLLINASERIIFDPAGTFELPFTPERNDVHFGMTPRAVAVYIDYHARESYNVIEQRLPVTAKQAEMIAKRAKEYGAVPKAQCTLAITRILKDISGFETISVGYFPKRASEWFDAQPGVQTRLITDDDADKNHNVLFEASR
ncbi:MAG: hypothetical protein HKN27_14335 [Silicimonas sp.]|nr:hypothetical protein [Silicimonas sp.]